MMRIFLTLSLFAFGLACTAFSDDVIKDDFSGESLSKNWASAKGEWKIRDGMLSGAGLKSDSHAAVLTYKAVHYNAKGEITFQLNGSKGFHLSFNHPKGHLFRLIVSESSAIIRTDKDKKDPASKPLNLETVEGTFEQGKRYTMNFEIAGETAAFEFDNGVRLEGSHASLAKEKMGYRLIVQGDGVLFDDFVIHSQE